MEYFSIFDCFCFKNLMVVCHFDGLEFRPLTTWCSCAEDIFNFMQSKSQRQLNQSIKKSSLTWTLN